MPELAPTNQATEGVAMRAMPLKIVCTYYHFSGQELKALMPSQS